LLWAAAVGRATIHRSVTAFAVGWVIRRRARGALIRRDSGALQTPHRRTSDVVARFCILEAIAMTSRHGSHAQEVTCISVATVH